MYIELPVIGVAVLMKPFWMEDGDLIDSNHTMASVYM